MAKASRDKGKRGELEVRNIFANHGIRANRTAQLQTGMRGVGDVTIDRPGWHIEVKRCETLKVPAWINQAQNDKPEGATPLIAFRRSRENWWAILPLDVVADMIGRLD